jgi:plasmid stability protein
MHMATLTIKNIPDPFVKRLKQQAAAHRRSVNLEVISYLEQMTHSVPVDPDALLAKARVLRRNPKGIRVTDRLLHSLKGRLKDMSKTNVREKQKSG